VGDPRVRATHRLWPPGEKVPVKPLDRELSAVWREIMAIDHRPGIGGDAGPEAARGRRQGAGRRVVCAPRYCYIIHGASVRPPGRSVIACVGSAACAGVGAHRGAGAWCLDET